MSEPKYLIVVEPLAFGARKPEWRLIPNIPPQLPPRNPIGPDKIAMIVYTEVGPKKYKRNPEVSIWKTIRKRIWRADAWEKATLLDREYVDELIASVMKEIERILVK